MKEKEFYAVTAMSGSRNNSVFPDGYNRKMGTVEPRYNDTKVMLTSDDCICDDDLAFIYGAIKKYGTDPEYLEDLRIYITKIADYIGKR